MFKRSWTGQTYKEKVENVKLCRQGQKGEEDESRKSWVRKCEYLTSQYVAFNF